MDKKYLKETSEFFMSANFEELKESECLYVKVEDVYKLAEQFLCEDYVGFIADHSNGEAEDSLRKLEFIRDLINYNPELSMAIKDRVIFVNALRKRHMEIEEQEDELDRIKGELESEENAIKAQLSEIGLIGEEEDEVEEEIYDQHHGE